MNERLIGYQASILAHALAIGAILALGMSEIKISRTIEIDFGFVKEETPKSMAQAEPAPARRESNRPVARREAVKHAPPAVAQKEAPVAATEPAIPVGKETAASANAARSGSGAPGALDNVRFGSASGPNFIRRVIPEYPFAAKRMNREGSVLLKLTIDEKGKLLNVEVVKGAGFGFTEAAVEAVRKSTYRPAVVNGRAVLSKALLPVSFRLTRQHSS